MKLTKYIEKINIEDPRQLAAAGALALTVAIVGNLLGDSPKEVTEESQVTGLASLELADILSNGLSVPYTECCNATPHLPPNLLQDVAAYEQFLDSPTIKDPSE